MFNRFVSYKNETTISRLEQRFRKHKVKSITSDITSSGMVKYMQATLQ
mgnify:CR=1 FL=1